MLSKNSANFEAVSYIKTNLSCSIGRIGVKVFCLFDSQQEACLLIAHSLFRPISVEIITYKPHNTFVVERLPPMRIKWQINLKFII